MPNIAAVLKDEIRRLARKEIKTCTTATRQAVAQYRREIASLRRQIQEQQKKIKRVAAQSRSDSDSSEMEEEPLASVRYSARSVRAQRRRLGLSAHDYGRLVGVSGLTIYNWEHGKARPRKAQLVALISVRGIGKCEATKRLAALAKKSAAKRRRKQTRR